MGNTKIKFHNSWDKLLTSEMKKDYFIQLMEFVTKEQKQNIIYPPQNLIFNAFQKTGFDETKIVILGQDPYHGENQAHGLSFSVQHGIAIPRSLKNIYKEMEKDLGITPAKHGNLEKWAQQGVLLLNTILTVRANQPKSHHKQGWETFTDTVITTLSNKKENLVFMLWGNDAIAKEELINSSKHMVLKAAHPSPFSAARGFFGCKHFSKANDYLTNMGKAPVDWCVE